MNVAYVGEQAEPLQAAYRWHDVDFDERQRPLFITYTIRQYRIFNPLVASCLGDLYQVVMRNGEKVKCYRSDDKLIVYDSKMSVCDRNGNSVKLDED